MCFLPCVLSPPYTSVTFTSQVTCDMQLPWVHMEKVLSKDLRRLLNSSVHCFFFHLCAGIPLSCFPINNWAFSLPKLSKWRRDKGLGWKSLARFSLTAAFLLQLTFAQTTQATDTTPTSLLPTSWDRRPGLSPLCPQGIEPSLQGHSTLVLGDTESVTMGRLRLNIFWLQVRHPAPEIWETWHLSQARKRARDSCQRFSPTSAMRSYLGANPFLSSKAVTSSPFSKTNTWLFDESLVPWHL